jgi:hypothetical protein
MVGRGKGRLDRFCNGWYDRLVQAQEGGPAIYHYTGPNALLGILGDKVLRATNIAFLNDGAEYYHALRLITEALEQGAERLPKALAEGMRARIESVEENVPAVYVVSFSRRPDLLSQWRGYGEVESGFCIGFGIEELSRLTEGPGMLLTPCVYEEESQRRFAADLVAMLAEMHTERGGCADAAAEALLDEAFAQLAWFAALFKHPGFAEEQEWRIVRHVRDDEAADLRFFSRSTCIASYLPLSFGSEAEAVREVWVGPSRHQHLSVQALRSLLRQGGYPESVGIHRSAVPFRLV